MIKNKSHAHPNKIMENNNSVQFHLHKKHNGAETFKGTAIYKAKATSPPLGIGYIGTPDQEFSELFEDLII